jgi:hypothetical protein
MSDDIKTNSDSLLKDRTSKNDVTGDSIKTKTNPSEAWEKNYDQIDWSKK